MAKTPHNLYILPRIIPPEDTDSEFPPRRSKHREKIIPPPTSPETSIRIERGTPRSFNNSRFKPPGKSKDSLSSKSSSETQSVKIVRDLSKRERKYSSLHSLRSSTPVPPSTSWTGESVASINSEVNSKKSSSSLPIFSKKNDPKDSYSVNSDQIRDICFSRVLPEIRAVITSSGSDVHLKNKVLDKVYLRSPESSYGYNHQKSTSDEEKSPKVVIYKESHLKNLSSEEFLRNVLLRENLNQKEPVLQIAPPSDRSYQTPYKLNSEFEIYNSTPKLSKQEQTQRKYSSNQKREKIQNKCSERQQKIECDVTLILKGRCFHSFKRVLSSNSTWFLNIFQNMSKDCTSIIEFSDMSAQTFDIVHKWMFSKDIRLITCQNVVQITQMAFQLRIPELLEFCLQFANQNYIKLSKSIFTPLPYPNNSKQSPSPNKNKNKNKNKDKDESQVILDPRYFQQIIRCSKFFSLKISTITTLLSEDDLNVESEVEVFDAAVAWLSYDWTNRVIHADKLLHCIRFGCLTNQELISIVYHCKNIAILSLPICRDLILRSYLYWSANKSNLLRRLNVPLPSVQPRTKFKKHKQCMLGKWEAVIRIQAAWRGYRVRNMLAIRDGAAAVIQGAFRGYLTRLWIKECVVPTIALERKQEMKKILEEEAAIIIQRATRKYLKYLKESRLQRAAEKLMKKVLATSYEDLDETTLLLIGGYDMSNNFDYSGCLCYLYKLHKRNWELISTIPEPIYYGKAAIIENCVYVTGGCKFEKNSDAICSLNCAWKWDLRQNTWIRIADMNCARIHHTLVAAIGRVFAIGGRNEEEMILNSVEMYEPDSNEWYIMSPMIVCRMGHCAVCSKDLIIVCGGVGLIDKPYGEILDSVEIYSPKNDKWTLGINTRIPRCFSSLVEYNDCLYLVGGISFATQIKGSVSVIDKCDDFKSEWYPLIETNLPIHLAATGMIGSYLCVVGGLCSQLGGPISTGNCYDLKTAKKVDDFNISFPVKVTGMCWVQVPLALAVYLNRI